jgi:hypothetical protein
MTSTLITDELPSFDDPTYELEAFLAAEDSLHISWDWNDHTANAATLSTYALFRHRHQCSHQSCP